MRHLSFSIALILAASTLAACAHVESTPQAHVNPVIPKPQPKPVDRSIGTATMLPDGTIVMELRTSMDHGGAGHMTQKIKPSDMQYASTLKQLGGLKPGQSKPITDYPLQ